MQVDSLKQIGALAKLPEDRLKQLATHLRLKTFARNAVILEQGQPADRICLLISGVVKVSHNGREKLTIVSLLSPGQFFGFDALIPGSEQPFRCTAFDTSTVGSIDARRFVEIMFATSYEKFLPGFAATLLSTQGALLHCIRGIPLDLRRRLALELIALADHFGSDDPRGRLITLALSHETLAEIVGGSRQQVTEYLNAFDREGLIVRDGRRIIVIPGRLREIIEGRPEAAPVAGRGARGG